MTTGVDGNGATRRDVTAIRSSLEVPVATAAGGTTGLPAPAVVPPASRHTPTPGVLDSTALQPFVTAVTAELCIAMSILTATAVLVGRPPPT